MNKIKVKITFPIVFAVLNILGLALAIFLWYSKLNSHVIGCITGGCDAVMISPYAKIFDVPIAAYGVAYYGAGLLFSVLRFLDERPLVRLFSWIAGVFGLFFSGYFVYLQAFKIGSWCSWCLMSGLFTILLLIVAITEIMQRGGLNAIKKDAQSVLRPGTDE